MRAAAALMRLASLSTRVEPLLNDLHNQLLGAEPGVQHALLCAIGGVLRTMAKPVGEAVLASLKASACGLLCGDEPELCDAAAYVLGGLARWGDAEGGGNGCDAEALLDAAEEASQEEADAWKQSRAQMRVHLSLLRHDVMHPGSLGPSLAAIYATAAEAAAHEKMDLRQLAAHSLARVGAAMARPEEAEVQAALAELQAEDGAAEVDGAALTIALALALELPLTLTQILTLALTLTLTLTPTPTLTLTQLLTRWTARPRPRCASRSRRRARWRCPSASPRCSPRCWATLCSRCAPPPPAPRPSPLALTLSLSPCLRPHPSPHPSRPHPASPLPPPSPSP